MCGDILNDILLPMFAESVSKESSNIEDIHKSLAFCFYDFRTPSRLRHVALSTRI